MALYPVSNRPVYISEKLHHHGLELTSDLLHKAYLLSSLRLGVWWLLLVYPLLAVGADLGWAKRKALRELKFTTGLFVFNMDESRKTKFMRS